MAVVTASSLRKELAGSLLFEGVSFSVERRDRLALSGPNGAGKTTLLRMLVGESEVHGGELAFAKGTRIALHDQRPPLDRGLSLREHALTGARDLIETEEELRRLEQAMAGGDHAQATLRQYAEAQTRLEHAGGYNWRDRAAAALRGLGFAERDLERPLETFSGGELTRASLARALAGDPDLLLLDEPTNHLDVASLEWLEQRLPPIHAAGGGGSPHPRLRRAVARVAQGARGARAGARPRDRAPGGRDRAARAVRRPLSRRHARAPGA